MKRDAGTYLSPEGSTDPAERDEIPAPVDDGPVFTGEATEETVELEDRDGNRTVVPVAHWRRWPQLADVFTPVNSLRPVADDKATPVAVEPPTGDKKKEN